MVRQLNTLIQLEEEFYFVSGWSALTGFFDANTWYYLPLDTTGTLQFTIHFVFVYIFPYALLVSNKITNNVTGVKKYEVNLIMN